MKHSKAPWRNDGNTVDGPKIWSGSKVIAHCPVLVNTGESGTTPDERVFNACLISAAIDMYTELRLVEVELMGWAEECPVHLNKAVIQRLLSVHRTLSKTNAARQGGERRGA